MQIHAFDYIIRQARRFFQERLGFIEVPTQSRLSIMAACEDPFNLTTFSINQMTYPLPQTGQMWLEVELLKNPGIPGVFCITTSYRDEKNIIPGRHNRIFPMFEFEAKGTLDDLRAIEKEFVTFLGFDVPVSLSYEKLCEKYQTKELTADHELKMQQEFGDSISLEKFPKRTNPFWNMKYLGNDEYAKIDVILCGMETIGSAERETDPQVMRDYFLTISDGRYAQQLFDKFGKDRVMAELDEYLSLSFFPRFGAGMGLTRLARAMEMTGLLAPVPAAA